MAFYTHVRVDTNGFDTNDVSLLRTCV